MSTNLIDLLNAVQRAQAAESKLRIILLRGNPRQIVQQLGDLMVQVRGLEAMSGKEHQPSPNEGRQN